MSDPVTVIATVPTVLSYNYTFGNMGNCNEAAGSAFENPAAIGALQMANVIISMKDCSAFTLTHISKLNVQQQSRRI